MVHGEVRIALCPHGGDEGAVGGYGSRDVHALRAQAVTDWRDHLFLFPSQVPTFSGMWIESKHGDARRFQSEAGLQRTVHAT